MSYSIPTCEECGDEYDLRDGCDPSKYCDECAQVRVIALEAQNAELLRELRDLSQLARVAMLKANAAVELLARWCVAVEDVGTSWDDWDEHYKDANWRPSPLRKMIDSAKVEIRKEFL